jgi:hypothetical protein
MADLINAGIPFRSDQLDQLGLSQTTLRSMLREHEVRRVFRRVYVAAPSPDSRELRAAALQLVMPPHGSSTDAPAHGFWESTRFLQRTD